MNDTPARQLILVCDDDPLIRFNVVTALTDAGYDTVEAGDGDAALEVIANTAPAAVLLDLGMPRRDGLSALRVLREGGNEVPVVVFTADGRVENAIAATRLGAAAYLQKPLDTREIVLAIERALSEDHLKREVQVLRGRRRGYGDFIGRSAALGPLFADLGRLTEVVAPTVLLLGESGTGKEVVARSLHANGPRKSSIFVEVDCTALSEQLMGSELFGHERGAFTDAKTTKRGLFEVAAGGIVFLDEIGELPLTMQAKLLRTLENRTFKRVGGVANLKLDASIIAATNRELKEEVDAGRFREDLYYRLNVITLRIPPLRERREDIPMLAGHFLERFNDDFGRTKAGTAIEGIDGDAMAMMLAYPWPGNVRELKNVMERISILGDPGLVTPDDLPSEVRFGRAARSGGAAGAASKFPFLLPETGVVLDDIERDFVVQALERTQGNQTTAAGLLGISRFQLRNRIERFGLRDKALAT